MEFDLEIAIPVCSSGKYLQRFLDFKKHGLRNTERFNVLISLLTGTDTFEDISIGWPDGVVVRQIKSDKNQCSAKVYDYYRDYDPEDFNNIRWFARMDDDSITNIDGLMNFLNEIDTNKDYYFLGEQTIGENRVEIELFEKLSLLHKIKNEFIHEIEVCIVSNSAFRKIITNETNKKILNERAKIEDGYTDICFALMSKLCGIYPSQLSCLTSDADLEGLIYGTRNHIHYIAHDINPFAHRIMTTTNNFDFCEKPFLLGKYYPDSEIPDFVFAIKLLKNGLIECKEDIRERYWTYFPDFKNLLLFDRMFEMKMFKNFDGCFGQVDNMFIKELKLPQQKQKIL